MNDMTLRAVALTLVGAGFALAPEARAQDDASVELDAHTEVGVQGEMPAPVAYAPPQPVAPEPGSVDGVRFRGAIAASGGVEFASGFEVGMGGIEGRLGVQINHLIGVYVQPSLSFGGGVISNIPVITGTAGVSALIDFTFFDRLFVGIGGGVGILNNPVGPELHIRVGGYPVMGFGADGYSREGLVVSLDSRIFFLSGGGGDLIVGQILGCIGYEVY